MIHRIHTLVLYLAILFIPIQTSKHFWPSFSYISGIRVDYLSPTIYVSDFLIILSIILYSLWVLKKRDKPFTIKHLFYSLIFLAILITPLFFSATPKLHMFGMLRVMEYFLFAVVISHTIDQKKTRHLVHMLIAGGTFSALLALIQLSLQHSLGGPITLLGEPVVHQSVIGVAKMNIDNALFIRPYGTFPHPNVLAFYLYSVFVLGAYQYKELRKKEKKLYIGALSIVFLGILATFSRIVIIELFIASAFFLQYYVRLSKAVFLKVITAFAILFIFFGNALYYRFFTINEVINSILDRKELSDIAVLISNEHIFTGVGINGYFQYQIVYQKIINETFLQPVHNVYLLVLLQLGIFGLIFVLLFLFFTVKRVLMLAVSRSANRHYFSAVCVIVVSGIVVSLTDHFFATLHQGMMISALFLGLAWIEKN